MLEISPPHLIVLLRLYLIHSGCRLNSWINPVFMKEFIHGGGSGGGRRGWHESKGVGKEAGGGRRGRYEGEGANIIKFIFIIDIPSGLLRCTIFYNVCSDDFLRCLFGRFSTAVTVWTIFYEMSVWTIFYDDVCSSFITSIPGRSSRCYSVH